MLGKIEQKEASVPVLVYIRSRPGSREPWYISAVLYVKQITVTILDDLMGDNFLLRLVLVRHIEHQRNSKAVNSTIKKPKDDFGWLYMHYLKQHISI